MYVMFHFTTIFPQLHHGQYPTLYFIQFM